MGTVDPYVYDGTDVLKNLFGEQDQDRLTALEQEQSLEAIAGLRTDPVRGRFNAAHLREIDRRIFAGVYPFAGRDRTVPLSKNEIVLGGRSVRYAEPGEIAAGINRATAGLAAFRFDATRPKASHKELARHHAEIWQVHPFREGNTRAVLAFALQHAQERGFGLDAPALARHPSETRDALALAAEGDGGALSAILHRAWRSQRERTHARIGRLTSEATEVLRLLGAPPSSRLPQRGPRPWQDSEDCFASVETDELPAPSGLPAGSRHHPDSNHRLRRITAGGTAGADDPVTGRRSRQPSTPADPGRRPRRAGGRGRAGAGRAARPRGERDRRRTAIWAGARAS